MAVNTLCVALVVLFCHLFSFSSAGFLDGGTSGDDDSPFLTGTLYKPKVKIGLTCSRLNTSSNLKVAISVFENDNQFNTTGGPNGNNVVTWAKCQMIDVAMYRNSTNPMKQRLHSSGCNVTRVDSNGPVTADDVDERTLATSFEFDPLGTTVPCGGLQEGTSFTFLMECFRHEHVTKHFDFMAQFTCDNNTALIRQLDTNTMIGPPEVNNITRRVYVEQKLFWVRNQAVLTRDSRLEYVEVSPQLMEVTSATTLPLGASLILQSCLKINSTSDSRPYFQDNGLEYMGLNIKQMTFSNIESVNPVQTNQPNSQQVVFNRCANQTEPMSELSGQASLYYPPDVAGTKWELISPNCVVVGPWSAAAFVTKNVGISKMNISGEYEYCKTSKLTNSVNNCFGDLSTPNDITDGYAACPAAGRKRRDASTEVDIEFDNPDGLPTGFNFEILVDTDESSEEQGIETGSENFVAAECFEKDTFAILTAVLGFLLAAVLMTSAFLACRIQSVRREVKGSSKNSFSNKGYF